MHHQNPGQNTRERAARARRVARIARLAAAPGGHAGLGAITATPAASSGSAKASRPAIVCTRISRPRARKCGSTRAKWVSAPPTSSDPMTTSSRMGTSRRLMGTGPYADPAENHQGIAPPLAGSKSSCAGRSRWAKLWLC
jgi:hypothetical protein